MEIKIAREIGYCYGVRDAVELAVEESKKESEGEIVYSLGPIIHNKQTIDMLQNEYNVQSVDSPKQIPDDSTVVIRTHGTTPDRMGELKKRGLNVVDATCPFVLKSQRKAKEFVDQGYFLVIFGKKAHPEVIGIKGFAGNKCVVVEHEEDLEKVPRSVKLAALFQSTVTFEDFKWAIPKLTEKAYEFKLLKTICGVTITRQKRTEEVAKEVEVMIIIGGKNSSNTKALVHLCEQYVKKTHWIEEPSEIDNIDFAGINSVGISTGTSTPDTLVDEVVARLHKVAALAEA